MCYRMTDGKENKFLRFKEALIIHPKLKRSLV